MKKRIIIISISIVVLIVGIFIAINLPTIVGYAAVSEEDKQALIEFTTMFQSECNTIKNRIVSEKFKVNLIKNTIELELKQAGLDIKESFSSQFGRIWNKEAPIKYEIDSLPIYRKVVFKDIKELKRLASELKNFGDKSNENKEFSWESFGNQLMDGASFLGQGFAYLISNIREFTIEYRNSNNEDYLIVNYYENSKEKEVRINSNDIREGYKIEGLLFDNKYYYTITKEDIRLIELYKRIVRKETKI